METEVIKTLLDEIPVIWAYSEDLPPSVKSEIQKKISELQKILEKHLSE